MTQTPNTTAAQSPNGTALPPLSTANGTSPTHSQTNVSDTNETENITKPNDTLTSTSPTLETSTTVTLEVFSTAEATNQKPGDKS